MMWIDIASIVFACVTMNHLGLISAIEDVTHRKLWIVNCPKCSTFWSALVYTTISTHDVITSLAISFLASYIALWLELLEGFVDTLYLKLYGKITSADNDNEIAASSDGGNSASTLPEL
jgi:hypothetical protein